MPDSIILLKQQFQDQYTLLFYLLYQIYSEDNNLHEIIQVPLLEYNKESENEYHIMKWLQEKLPVPKVLAYEILNEKSYLLMSKSDGKIFHWKLTWQSFLVTAY